jgi:hypothetical protein
MIGLIREMKTFLSKELRRNIRKYEPRVEKMFMDGDKFKFWKENNSSKLIESEWFMEQKVDYIHMNPVKKLYVYDPEDWMWSSASKVPGRIKLSQY